MSDLISKLEMMSSKLDFKLNQSSQVQEFKSYDYD